MTPNVSFRCSCGEDLVLTFPAPNSVRFQHGANAEHSIQVSLPHLKYRSPNFSEIRVGDQVVIVNTEAGTVVSGRWIDALHARS